MSTKSNKQYFSLWEVVSLGIGSMVGAGIFALMGQTILVAHHGVYLSFLVGGIAALISGYSYAKLGSRYPGSGGIMDYFEKAFPNKTVAGTLTVVYLLTLAITISLVAKSFGAYASNMLALKGGLGEAASGGFASLAILFLAYINMAGTGAVGKTEVLFVGFKMLILILLIACGLKAVSPFNETHFSSPQLGSMFSSVGLAFFAYAGYGMMANTAGNLKNPSKTLPLAIFLAIGLVMLLYMVLSYVVLKSIQSPSELAAHSDTVLAQIATPLLGTWGSLAVSIAALIASASAINATYYSYLNISRGLAKVRQLPTAFATPFWREGSKGFVWSVAGILLITNLFNLEAIANIASATFLVSYLAVFVAHWKLRKETTTHALPILAGFILMLAILLAFIGHIYRSQPAALFVLAAFFCVIFLIQRYRAR